MTPIVEMQERIRDLHTVLRVFAAANWPDTEAGRAASNVYSALPKLTRWAYEGAWLAQSKLPHRVLRNGRRMSHQAFGSLEYAVGFIADRTGKHPDFIKEQLIIFGTVAQEDGDQSVYSVEVKEE